MILETKDTVFVFDLDDTLYQEADYHQSGLKSVRKLLNVIFKIDIQDILDELVSQQEEDIWGKVCENLSFPASVKEALIWQYRLHEPEITLSREVISILNHLQQFSGGVAIVTDGRVITQRRKLLALKIDHIPAYISEEFGAVKPDLFRFRLIERKYPNFHFVYIADNPRKDFFGPNKLGWTTIGVRGCERNVHSQDVSSLNREYLPDIWISSLVDLWDYLS